MPSSPQFFWVPKKKKGDKGEKERALKQKLSKGCHQGQNIIVLAILERLELPTMGVPCLPPPSQQNLPRSALFTQF